MKKETLSDPLLKTLREYPTRICYDDPDVLRRALLIKSACAGYAKAGPALTKLLLLQDYYISGRNGIPKWDRNSWVKAVRSAIDAGSVETTDITDLKRIPNFDTTLDSCMKEELPADCLLLRFFKDSSCSKIARKLRKEVAKTLLGIGDSYPQSNPFGGFPDAAMDPVMFLHDFSAESSGTAPGDSDDDLARKKTCNDFIPNP